MYYYYKMYIFLLAITIKGCFFHFGQSLYKKFTGLGNFRALYEAGNEECIKWFTKVFCLALVPEVAALTLWKEISENIPAVMDVLPTLLFAEYFSKYYIKGPFAGMWSHYETKGAKTNNHVEAYNLALKKFVNYKSNLNIYESIELFQCQELYSRRKMAELELDKPNRRKQDPDVRARNDTYNNLKKLRELGHLSNLAFLESIVNIYKIIVHKTVHDIDLSEPVCDVICFNPNLLISEESEELPDLSF
jgi:hypothetical protein